MFLIGHVSSRLVQSHWCRIVRKISFYGFLITRRGKSFYWQLKCLLDCICTLFQWRGRPMGGNFRILFIGIRMNEWLQLVDVLLLACRLGGSQPLPISAAETTTTPNDIYDKVRMFLLFFYVLNAKLGTVPVSFFPLWLTLKWLFASYKLSTRQWLPNRSITSECSPRPISYLLELSCLHRTYRTAMQI